jgi:Rha family phage regulatory protein
MTDLVFQTGKGNPATTSLLVAKKFGKRHADVLRAIKNVISQTPENQHKRNFAFMVNIRELPDGGKREEPMYVMTKDGFYAIVLGFTGKEAINFRWEFINAFNKMEEIIKSQHSQTSQKLIGDLKKLEDEFDEVAEDYLDMEEYMNKVFQSDNKIDIGEVSKILKLHYGRNTLFKKLREDGIFFKNNRKNEPKQQYIKNGYFEMRQVYIENIDQTVVKTCVTQKGLEFLNDKYGE